MSSQDELRSCAQNWRDVSPLLEAMRDRELIESPLSVALAFWHCRFSDFSNC